MRMLVSTKGRYALRIMIDLAEHQRDGYIPLKETAGRQGISEKYMEGIIKILVKDKMLTGVRGKGGGYKLTKSPDQYTVGSILRLTEGSLAPVSCLESPDQNLRSESLRNQAAERDKTVKQQELLNAMWRNTCINDTYEPGSTFKIITAAAGLEEGVVKLTDPFSCPGFRVVEDRRIRCHKAGGHGAETFLQGVMNSCNPVFIDVGQRLGSDNYYKYFVQFGLKQKTGIDLPGEAATIMHKKENIGPVELATISFGQSFQITPIQLITTAASIVNGGRRITPHFALGTVSPDGKNYREFSWPLGKRILSEETSATMRYVLEQVVAEGSGRKAAVEGFSIGGKTATSEKLPRSRKKYISSFLGFAPANDPKVIALITIDEPEGIYYGGLVAAPVVRELFENILPCMDTSKPLS